MYREMMLKVSQRLFYIYKMTKRNNIFRLMKMPLTELILKKGSLRETLNCWNLSYYAKYPIRYVHLSDLSYSYLRSCFWRCES